MRQVDGATKWELYDITLTVGMKNRENGPKKANSEFSPYLYK